MPAVLLAMAAAGLVAAFLTRSALGAAARGIGEELGMRPGKWFSWSELTVTNTGKSNELTDAGRAALRLLVGKLLDPLRERLGRPVRVNSAWRSPSVNDAIAGHANDSQHKLGEAADISVSGMSAREIAQVIVDADLPFDQMIWYAPERGGHLHVSYTERRANRRQVLHAPAGTGYVASTITPSSTGVA